MNIRRNGMRELFAALALAAALAGGVGLVRAQDAGGAHKGMHGAMHHGAAEVGMHAGRQGKSHGKCGKHGEGHGGKHGQGHHGQHLFGDHWKKTLSAEQEAQLDRLHLEYAKKKHVLKSGIGALKMQLAVLAIADQPQQEAINAQVDELLMAKRQLMQAKYAYIAAQRQVLTPDQRVSFDMEVIHRAEGTGKKKGHGGSH